MFAEPHRANLCRETACDDGAGSIKVRESNMLVRRHLLPSREDGRRVRASQGGRGGRGKRGRKLRRAREASSVKVPTDPTPDCRNLRTHHISAISFIYNLQDTKSSMRLHLVICYELPFQTWILHISILGHDPFSLPHFSILVVDPTGRQTEQRPFPALIPLSYLLSRRRVRRDFASLFLVSRPGQREGGQRAVNRRQSRTPRK